MELTVQGYEDQTRTSRATGQVVRGGHTHAPTKGAHMSNIVVLGFANEEAADEFSAKLRDLYAENNLIIVDAVKVTVGEDSKVKLHREGMSAIGGDAVVGGFLGAAVGLLFLNPVAGAAVGAAAGAGYGAHSGAHGIDKDFIEGTSDVLQPGTAALFLQVDEANADRVKAQIEGTQATVIMTTLSAEAEAQLRAALGDQGATE
jgi:uncharacterized membrane protein